MSQSAMVDYLQSRSLVSRFTHQRFDKSLKFSVEKAFALSIISTSDSLQKCTPESVGQSILDVGILGVSLSPALRQAFLVPYWNSKAAQHICTVSLSYMGMEHIAYRTGQVTNIQTVVVRQGDEFRVFTKDNRRQIDHVESAGERGKTTHAYCIATFATGDTHVEVMDRADIDAIKAAATKMNRGQTPFTWTGPFRHEMYRKSVMRRAWKHWPKWSDDRYDKVLDAVSRTDPIDFSAVAREEAGGESLTLSGPEIDELTNMMKEAGIPAAAHDRQLIGLAKSLGYRSIEAVKIEDFEIAKKKMSSGLDKRAERINGGAQ